MEETGTIEPGIIIQVGNSSSGDREVGLQDPLCWGGRGGMPPLPGFWPRRLLDMPFTPTQDFLEKMQIWGKAPCSVVGIHETSKWMCQLA